MMKIIISLLLITSVSFAQSKDSKAPKKQKSIEELLREQDPALRGTDQMSRVKDLASDCPSCNHTSLLANNPACLVEGLCAEGYSPIEDSKSNKGTN